ncbi:MAG TPA: ABC transporter substrate-binding protein, partial [Burkholderiaceae bacterium]|nr:ABC transporter substrate-binding protein [Burkholderiaceae bacterium]
MYDAKEAGRNTYRYFNQQVHDSSVRRLAIEHRLRGAVKRDKFRLVYQPLVATGTGHLIGAEALGDRRHHRRLAPPALCAPRDAIRARTAPFDGACATPAPIDSMKPVPSSPIFYRVRNTLLQLALLALPCAAAPAAPAAVQDEAPPASRAAATKAPVKTGSWEHALSAYVPPKYPRGFTHFEYVNPEAPKGGELRLRNPDRRTSFDKFNPFTVKGNAPAGLVIYMFETLAQVSQDEPQAMYGLLAEEMYVAPDMSSISFRLHPKARFANGDPVTPADVKASFEHMSGPQAAPYVQAGLAGIERVAIVDARTVRFDLKDRKVDTLFTAGGMAVFSAKWGAGKKFDEIITEYPITSGPYVIGKVDMPRRIEFKRNPDYWAKDLGVRRGWFNFDRVIYRMYQDHAISREAFKAGEFDIMKEYG